jgi:uncharacterized protein
MRKRCRLLHLWAAGTGCLLLWGLWLGPAISQSASAAEPAPVDCQSPKAADEVAICANQDLRTLDGEMDRAYRAARIRWTASMSGSVKAAQLDWLKKRAACGADTRCLFDRYVEQITWLDSYRPPSPTWLLDKK